MIIKLLQEPGESGPRYCDYRTSLNQTSIARHNSMQQDKNDAASADHKVKSEHSQVVHVCHEVECSAGSLVGSLHTCMNSRSPLVYLH